jgi:hypothetical protein
MEYMLITQSTDWFRNNIPPGVFRLIECTKKQAIAYAKALFDEVVEQENHVILSHDWDEQKGVGIIRYYGGDEVRMNLFTIAGSVLEEFK